MANNVVVILVVLLFGRKISSLMGDVAKGIKSLEEHIRYDDNEPKNVSEDNQIQIKRVNHILLLVG